MLNTNVFKPGLAYQAYQAQEDVVRKGFLTIGKDNTQTLPLEQTKVHHLLRMSALFLEMVLVVSCGMELLSDVASQSQGEIFSSQIKTQCGLDIDRVFQEALKEFPVLNNPPTNPALPSMPIFMRSVRSIVAACPIDVLEELGSHQGLENFGFRCHRAFEALNAFIFRQDPQIQKRAKLVGQIYAKGELTLEEVSVLLDLSSTDAIWWLEQSGYSRSIQVIQLTDVERDRRFSQMRNDRLDRKGEPVFSEDHLLRDVVSSERIEGVDARLWFSHADQ